MLLTGLIIFMILGAVVAIETRDLLSSVIAVGVMGMALAIVFLILGAPDLALVQVAVEIIALVMLIRLVLEREDVTIAHRYRYAEVFATSVGLVFCGVFIMFAAIAFTGLTPFGSPLMRVSRQYLTDGFELTHIANIMTAILLEFRAYDTLGEATVIFTAVLGSFVILRRQGRASHDRDDTDR